MSLATALKRQVPSAIGIEDRIRGTSMAPD